MIEVFAVGLVAIFGFWFVWSFLRFMGRGKKRHTTRDIEDVREKARRRL